MRLPALEFVEGRQVRVAIIERDDQPKVNLVVGRVIQEPATFGVIIQRPAGRMNDEPLLVPLGFDFPDLLDTDAVVLRIGILAQPELRHEFFAEVAAYAFRENRVLAEQLVTRCEGTLLFAVLANPHVAGRHAGHAPLGVVEHLGGSEAREHVDAHGFRLLAQPLAQLAEADDVVTVIVHGTRQEQPRNRDRAGCAGQVVNPIAGTFRPDRRTLFFPVGNQFIEAGGLEDVPRQYVCADF